MCGKRSCRHEADALCTCRALRERDNNIMGLLTHIHENMKAVEWELDYTDLSHPEKRRLCLVGTCRVCGGRLCQELHASDELAGDDFLAAVSRHLRQYYFEEDRRITQREFCERFARMFHPQDRELVREWMERAENRSTSAASRIIEAPAEQEPEAGVTVYTLVRSGVDVDHGSFPAPTAEGSFISLLQAKAELQKLIYAEKEGLDDRYDCEAQDEEFWEMYQDGNAAALFSRLDILPSKLTLTPNDASPEVLQGTSHGIQAEEADVARCLPRMWRMQATSPEKGKACRQEDERYDTHG